MSLNCEEIDLILSEKPLEGMKIQNVFQPSYDAIALELYGKGEKLFYLISIAQNACRIHPLTSPPAKNERPLRFMECLKSKIKGGTILHAEQISKDRIIKIEIVRTNEEAIPSRFYLYARLWSGAGNVLLVSEKGIIIDALRRIPSRQEISGAVFALPVPREAAGQSAKSYSIRDLEGEGPFWQRIEHFYSEHTGQLSRDALLAQARAVFNRKYSSLENRLRALSARQDESEQAERFRQIGDILIGGYTIEMQGEKAFARTLDFYENREILIEIDPSETPAQNAARYYEKYRKAKADIDDIAAELKRCRASMNQLNIWLSRLEAEPDPIVIAQALRKGGAARTQEKMRFPCQHVEYKGWTILIGKSGKENDEILRHIARGSDLWLHARDYPGSYVFIRAIKNKDFPQEVIQTAARLALYYSKARKNLGGDVYTTYVKNLRRAKGGPIGRVIPYLEKNIYISFTEAQIKDILDNSPSGEE